MFKTYRKFLGLLPLSLMVLGCAQMPLADSPQQEKSVAKTSILTEDHDVNQPFMSVQLLGSVALLESEGLVGLSDLAWDEDEQLLYAISDFGKLFHLRPVFKQGRLSDVMLVAKYALLGVKGRSLSGKSKDAEGLTLLNADNGRKGDTELLVSFEGYPRIYQYDTEGVLEGDRELPDVLAGAENYKTSNDALEALTVHPQWGVLTSPERAMKFSNNKAQVTWFNLQDQRWLYPMAKEAGNAVVAMEALPSGEVLVLERAYVNPLVPFIINLRWVDTLAEPDTMQPLKVKTVARFNGGDGWYMDNFEGLTRHKEKRFFMVSDDNNHPFLQSLLVYFEVLQ
ncbi:MAG: esterase-like activity of phytase family protein [Gammaproteobacteria bacterium]|nr:esterase-like activity of phytase family protein [Gammaproteobacteria bacterium]